MNVRALRLFLRVMEQGSLASAAESLNLSPSAASRLLSGLEHGLGLTLFRRDRQRLTPTAEGHSLFDEARRVLLAVDELPRIARSMGERTQRPLRVMAMPRFAAALFAPALARFTRLNPEVRVEALVYHRTDFEQAFVAMGIDVGIASLPFASAVVVARPLLQLPAMVVLPRGHPLAGHGSLGAEDLRDERVVAMQRGTRARSEIEDMLAAAGAALAPAITVSSLDLACRLVEWGAGVTIADPLTARGIAGDRVVLVPWRPHTSMHIGVLLPALHAPNEAALRFRDALIDEAETLTAGLAEHIPQIAPWRSSAPP